MRIVADEQLAGVEALFSPLGEISLLPAEAINAAALADADVLLIRSVTRVDECLLADSRLRFVGSATSGTDHVDLELLRRSGIPFACARGSNAEAVADYAMTALAHWLQRPESRHAGFEVGIVGLGETGGRFARRLLAMGIPVRAYDPLIKAGSFGPVRSASWSALRHCRVISLHVPLTDSGKHSTRGMIDGEFLDGLPHGALLINSCRGGVVNEGDLLAKLSADSGLQYAADVWENEPEPDPRLVAGALLATPHIAGYSRRAKREATAALHRAFTAHFGLPAMSETPPSTLGTLMAEVEEADSPWPLFERALPIAALSARFKEAIAAGQGSDAFRALRREMLTRPEFSDFQVEASHLADSVRQALEVNRFRCIGQA